MDRMSGERSFEALEQKVQRLTEALSKEAREKRSGPRATSYISWLYQTHRARTVREILEGRSPVCKIPLEELHRYFSAMFDRDDTRGGPRPAQLPPLPRVDAHPALGESITPEEVRTMLKGTKNSTPGPDDIPFDLLKQWDLRGDTLAGILEDCRRFQRTPSDWKKSQTGLSFKRGDPNEPSSWRPIALCNTMYKLYAKCLAARIFRWAEAGKALSSQQKAFKAQEGCTGNRFLVQSVLGVAQSSKRECAVAFLDLANAHGSIPRCHIFETLAEFGMPEDFLGLLQELYEGCTTTIKVRQVKTAEIPLRTGLKQGCNLSSILFVLALEPLLRFIDGRSRGFSLHGAKICVLVYADDLVLVAESASEMQAMLDDATAAADWIGLRFQAAKCKSIHCRGGVRQPTEFSVQGEAISCLKEGETVQYLGGPMDLQKHPETLGQDFVANLKKIRKTKLKDWQKVDMVTRTLLPRTLSVLRDRHVPRKILRSLDTTLYWSGLYYKNGTELMVEELSDIEVVSHAFLLLSSPDGVVKAVAHGALREIVRETFMENPDEQDLASYLSGDQGQISGRDSTSLWTRARNATHRLGSLIDCQWIYNGELCFKLGRNVIYPKNVKTLARPLKRALSKKKEALQG